MKKILILIVSLYSLKVHAQETKEFDGHKWEAPYHLPIPQGWTIERFLIPISFAPQIKYSGVEDIRFAPGWAKTKSEEYWSYAFLWYVDGTISMSAPIIEKNLSAYYTGLLRVNRDSIQLKNFTKDQLNAKAAFKEITHQKNDLKTFRGTIEMIDYMQLIPISLNCIVHLRSCPKENKTILFYELSRRPYKENIWASLNQLWLDFECKKK